MDTSSEYSGGCQCGAVRFHVRGALVDASICHCRMCQKAFGAYYAPLVSVRGTEFRWTRGEPKRFASSTVVQRGFCADCGTPLTYEAPDGISVAAGAFDTPERLPPHIQYGLDRKLPFVDSLAQLPTRPPEDDAAAEAFWPAWCRGSIRITTLRIGPREKSPRFGCATDRGMRAVTVSPRSRPSRRAKTRWCTIWQASIGTMGCTASMRSLQARHWPRALRVQHRCPLQQRFAGIARAPMHRP